MLPTQLCRGRPWAVVGVLLAQMCLGDTVRLKDGRVFEGVIVENTAIRVTIDAKVSGIAARLSFEQADVQSVSVSVKAKPADPEGASPASVTPSGEKLPGVRCSVVGTLTVRKRNAEDKPSPPSDSKPNQRDNHGGVDAPPPELTTDGDPFVGELTATLRCDLPESTVWIVRPSHMERPVGRDTLMRTETLWTGYYTPPEPRTVPTPKKPSVGPPPASAPNGRHTPPPPARSPPLPPKISQTDPALLARWHFQPDCKKVLQGDFLATSSILVLDDHGRILRPRWPTTNDAGEIPEPRICEDSCIAVERRLQWEVDPKVKLSDLMRIAFGPRYEEVLTKLSGVRQSLEATLDKERALSVEVPVPCERCSGKGRLNILQRKDFTVEEERDYQYRLSAVVGGQQIYPGPKCSRCDGKGNLGTRPASDKWRALMRDRLALIEKLIGSVKEIQARVAKGLSELEAGAPFTEKEADDREETLRKSLVELSRLDADLKANDVLLRATPP